MVAESVMPMEREEMAGHDAYETVHDAQQGIVRDMTFYNQAAHVLDGRMPDRVY